MKNIKTTLVIVASIITFASCRKAEVIKPRGTVNMDAPANINTTGSTTLTYSSAFYFGSQVKMAMQPVSAEETKQVLSNTDGKYDVRSVFHTDDGPNTRPFIDVIDSRPENGKMIYWRKMQYGFADQKKSRQFYSSDDIMKATGGESPEIKLTKTNVLYQGYIMY